MQPSGDGSHSLADYHDSRLRLRKQGHWRSATAGAGTVQHMLVALCEHMSALGATSHTTGQAGRGWLLPPNADREPSERQGSTYAAAFYAAACWLGDA